MVVAVIVLHPHQRRQWPPPVDFGQPFGRTLLISVQVSWRLGVFKMFGGHSHKSPLLVLLVETIKASSRKGQRVSNEEETESFLGVFQCCSVLLLILLLLLQCE